MDDNARLELLKRLETNRRDEIARLMREPGAIATPDTTRYLADLKADVGRLEAEIRQTANRLNLDPTASR